MSIFQNMLFSENFLQILGLQFSAQNLLDYVSPSISSMYGVCWLPWETVVDQEMSGIQPINNCKNFTLYTEPFVSQVYMTPNNSNKQDEYA